MENTDVERDSAWTFTSKRPLTRWFEQVWLCVMTM